MLCEAVYKTPTVPLNMIKDSHTCSEKYLTEGEGKQVWQLDGWIDS